MHLQTTRTDLYQPALPFAPGDGASPIAECREPGATFESAAPRMIRSVVEEAGLGRFVYLQGVSGKRFVFSSISPEQATLYDNALFAVTGPEGVLVRIGKNLGELKAHGKLIFVHLLDRENQDEGDVLKDLLGSH